MLKIIFRPLFVILLLSAMILGQVTPLGNQIDLFEPDDGRERSWSESYDGDEGGDGRLPLIAVLSSHSFSRPDAKISLLPERITGLILPPRYSSHSPRSPPSLS